jgi:hypothetical protein
MKGSTKTALIAGGSVLGAGAIGTGLYFALRPKQTTPPTQTPPPTPPSPVWQLATTQVVAVPQAYSARIVQDVYSASLVLLPDQLQQFSFWVYLTNISTTNQKAYFGAQLLQHGTGQVVLNFAQQQSPQVILPGTTTSKQLVTQYSAAALGSMTLPTGAMDLAVSALDDKGSAYQQFSLPNAVQIENATNIGSVQAGTCPNKVVAGPYWAVYGGAAPLLGPNPVQLAQQQAMAVMRSLQGQYPGCPLSVLQIRAANTGTYGYVVAAGNPPASALQFNYSPPRYMPA